MLLGSFKSSASSKAATISGSRSGRGPKMKNWEPNGINIMISSYVFKELVLGILGCNVHSFTFATMNDFSHPYPVITLSLHLNPLTLKISLVILLTVCHIVLVTLVWRIWYWIN